jgi:hypothetical protein
VDVLRKIVSKQDVFKEYVKILNGVMGLSPREADLFSFILKRDYENDPGLMTYTDRNINSKAIRKQAMAELHLNDTNLSRYLGVLKEKGLVVRGTKGWVLNDSIRPHWRKFEYKDLNEKVYQYEAIDLKFILELGDATSGRFDQGLSRTV